jgi:GntR family transcriptional regulator
MTAPPPKESSIDDELPEYLVDHPRARTGSAHGRQISPRRVRDLISLSIRMGYISSEDQLVEHELMELFSTSRTSVRAALAQLSESGMIERRPRAGTKVLAVGITIPLADIAEVGQDVYLKIIEDRVVPNFPLARDRLRLDSEHVRMVENTFVHQGLPIGIRTAYFSQDVDLDPVAQVATGPQHMVSIMTEGFSARPGEVDVIIGVDAADTRDARLLRIPVGKPLVVREMTYYAENGDPVEIVFDRFRGDLIHIGGTAAVWERLPRSTAEGA